MRRLQLITINLIISLLLILFGCNEENKKPNCTIISPLNGTMINSGDTVNILVESNDSDGKIVEVELLLDSKNLGRINSFPFQHEWRATSIESGNHTLKAIAYDNDGATESDEIIISINATLPSILTGSIKNVTLNSAKCDGILINNGGEIIIERGICWSQSENPTIEDNRIIENTNIDTCTSYIMQLEKNTSYFVRAYATNSEGTSYGAQKNFTTYAIDDITGNYYHTVKIGDQVWMAENLNTTKFIDGTDIPSFDDQNQLYSVENPSYCWNYGNDNNTNNYGALYNWLVVSSYKVCPYGWHVPSLNEWNILANYLGGYSVAGGKLKEAGFDHWESPNIGATNSSGFTALPGGYIEYYQSSQAGNSIGKWWSADPNGSWHAYSLILTSNENSLTSDFIRQGSMCSIRCIED